MWFCHVPCKLPESRRRPAKVCIVLRAQRVSEPCSRTTCRGRLARISLGHNNEKNTVCTRQTPMACAGARLLLAYLPGRRHDAAALIDGHILMHGDEHRSAIQERVTDSIGCRQRWNCGVKHNQTKNAGEAAWVVRSGVLGCDYDDTCALDKQISSSLSQMTGFKCIRTVFNH